MTVQLQLSAQDDLVSHTIMEWTRGEYSHVDIVMPDGWLVGARSGVSMVNGVSYPAGVTRRPPGYAPFTATKIVTFWKPEADDKAFYDFVGAQIGKPYDTWGVAGLGADRDWHDPNKWFCSELVAAALEAGHFIQPLPTGFWFVSPRDIDLIGSVA